MTKRQAKLISQIVEHAENSRDHFMEEGNASNKSLHPEDDSAEEDDQSKEYKESLVCLGEFCKRYIFYYVMKKSFRTRILVY